MVNASLQTRRPQTVGLAFDLQPPSFCKRLFNAMKTHFDDLSGEAQMAIVDAILGVEVPVLSESAKNEIRDLAAISECPSCGETWCDGMVLYCCEVCGKDCCSECSDTCGEKNPVCENCVDQGYEDGYRQSRDA